MTTLGETKMITRAATVHPDPDGNVCVEFNGNQSRRFTTIHTNVNLFRQTITSQVLPPHMEGQLKSLEHSYTVKNVLGRSFLCLHGLVLHVHLLLRDLLPT